MIAGIEWLNEVRTAILWKYGKICQLFLSSLYSERLIWLKIMVHMSFLFFSVYCLNENTIKLKFSVFFFQINALNKGPDEVDWVIRLFFSSKIYWLNLNTCMCRSSLNLVSLDLGIPQSMCCAKVHKVYYEKILSLLTMSSKLRWFSHTLL